MSKNPTITSLDSPCLPCKLIEGITSKFIIMYQIVFINTTVNQKGLNIEHVSNSFFQ
jgi:hypothetical protein